MTFLQATFYVIVFLFLMINAYLIFEVKNLFIKAIAVISLILVSGWLSLDIFLTIFTW